MIAAALLALAVSASGALDAERSFARMAQTEGQWASFRAFAAPEAIMFAPGVVNAQQWLKDRAEPRQPVMWWPGRSWRSCDGTLAVNTGPWLREGGTSTGTFTTVWRRQEDGSWKWLLDHGRTTPSAVAAGDDPREDLPVCRNLPRQEADVPEGVPAPGLLVQLDDRMPGDRLPAAAIAGGAPVAAGMSDDGSLRWRVRTIDGAPEGAHVLEVLSWDGARLRLVLLEITGVPGL